MVEIKRLDEAGGLPIRHVDVSSEILQAVTLQDAAGVAVTSFGSSPSLTAISSGVTEESKSVTTVTSIAVAAGVVTIGGFIQNIGTTPCWLSIVSAKAAGSGIILGAYQSISFDHFIPNRLWTGAVNAITSTGTTTLWVVRA